MAASQSMKTFEGLLKSRKKKNTQVVLPSVGVVTAKVSFVGKDIAKLEAKVGGQSHVFFLHYTQVVIAT